MNAATRFGLVLAAIAFAIAALLAYHWFGAFKPTSMEGARPTVSPGTLYGTRYPDLTGASRSLAEWTGKPIVINFWAPWCAPCREELPILNRLQRDHPGVRFVAISVDTADNVRAFVAKLPIDYTVLVSGVDGIEFSRRLGNRLGVLPHTVLVASNGEAVWQKIGPITYTELDQLLRGQL